MTHNQKRCFLTVFYIAAFILYYFVADMISGMIADEYITLLMMISVIFMGFFIAYRLIFQVILRERSPYDKDYYDYYRTHYKTGESEHRFNNNSDNSSTVSVKNNLSASDTYKNEPLETITQKIYYRDLQERIRKVYADYAQTESDPRVIITMPTIKDINAPATKKFYKAFDNITPHYNKIINNNPNNIAKEKYIKLVEELETSWENAINTAQDIGLNGLGEKDKDRAYKLLNRIMYPSNEHELEVDKIALARILNKVVYNDGFRKKTLNTDKLFDGHSEYLSIAGGQNRKQLNK